MDHLITRLPLTEALEVVDDEELDRRRRRALEDLKTDVPALNFLRAGELDTGEAAGSDRLWLVVGLQLRREPDLFESSYSERERRRRFMEELQKVYRQLEQVEWRIREAVSNAASPLEEVHASPDEVATGAARRRVRRSSRQGRLWVAAPGMAREIDLGPLPRLLSRAPRIHMTALVESMSRDWVTLTEIQVSAEDRAVVNQVKDFHRCRDMHRARGDKHLPEGGLLQRSMDSASVLTLEVAVALDWQDGTVAHFELLAVSPLGVGEPT